MGLFKELKKEWDVSFPLDAAENDLVKILSKHKVKDPLYQNLYNDLMDYAIENWLSREAFLKNGIENELTSFFKKVDDLSSQIKDMSNQVERL